MEHIDTTVAALLAFALGVLLARAYARVRLHFKSRLYHARLAKKGLEGLARMQPGGLTEDQAAELARVDAIISQIKSTANAL